MDYLKSQFSDHFSTHKVDKLVNFAPFIGDCQKTPKWPVNLWKVIWKFTFKVVCRVCELLKKNSMNYHQNSGCEPSFNVFNVLTINYACCCWKWIFLAFHMLRNHCRGHGARQVPPCGHLPKFPKILKFWLSPRFFLSPRKSVGLSHFSGGQIRIGWNGRRRQQSIRFQPTQKWKWRGPHSPSRISWRRNWELCATIQQRRRAAAGRVTPAGCAVPPCVVGASNSSLPVWRRERRFGNESC